MPEALTFTSLCSDIELYAERSDAEFIAQIPRFIMLAENRIASEVRGLGHLRVATFSTTNTDPIYEKPARWRETTSLSILVSNSRVFLKNRSLQYLQTYWPNQSTTGQPLFYSDYDYEHFLVAPTPDAAYSGTITYHERPIPLDATNETNWTTQYAPQLLIYASLLEAQPFLKNQERIPEFQAMYDRAAAAIKQEESYRIADSSSVRG